MAFIVILIFVVLALIAFVVLKVVTFLSAVCSFMIYDVCCVLLVFSLLLNQLKFQPWTYGQGLIQVFTILPFVLLAS